MNNRAFYYPELPFVASSVNPRGSTIRVRVDFDRPPTETEVMRSFTEVTRVVNGALKGETPKLHFAGENLDRGNSRVLLIYIGSHAEHALNRALNTLKDEWPRQSTSPWWRLSH